MVVMHWLFTVLMAWVLTLIFAVGWCRRGPWSSILAFFGVVLLAAWAGSLWISPAGPVFMGGYWLPIVPMAFLAGLLPRRVETLSATVWTQVVCRRISPSNPQKAVCPCSPV